MKSDLLLMDKLNSLPHPLIGRFCGDSHWWEIHDIDVETGLTRINVSGLLEVKHFCELMFIEDANHNLHDPDDFYNEET